MESNRFEEKDFENLLLRGVHNLSDTDNALEKYPQLIKYKEFSKKIPNFNRILKYISFVYDINTPLQIIEDIIARKIEALRLCGIAKNDAYYEKCIRCSDDDIVSMIIRFIRMHKNLDYSEYMVYSESYYKQQEKLFTDDVSNTEKTKDFIANSTSLRKRMDDLRRNLFNDDLNRSLEVSLDYMVEEELLLRPELMAKLVKEKGITGAKEYLEQ